MKNNQLTLILVILFFLTTLAAVGLMVRYHISVHRLQDARVRANDAVILGKVFNQLIGESVEYSKKNPAIDPILQSLTNRAAAKAENK
jgi:hypothetical protein